MSGLTGISDFMKLWQQSDQTSERKLQKFLAAGLDEYVRGSSSLLSKIPADTTFTSPLIHWMEEEGYPDKITGELATATLTFSGKLFGANVTEANLYKVIRVGTILRRPSDNMQLRVSSISGIAGLAVTVAAHGNSSLSDDASGAVAYDILTEGWTDWHDVDSTRSLDRKFYDVGTQIFAETFEIPHTRENTKYEIVKDETEHQIKKLYEKIDRQLAHSVISVEPYYNGGSYKFGNQAEESFMQSLKAWTKLIYAEDGNTNCYKDMSSIALTRTTLDDIIRNQWLDRHADYNAGDWWIVVHPNVAKLIADMDLTMRETTRDDKGVGVIVDYFDAKVGKRFKILSDPYMLSGDLWVLNLNAPKYGYMANDKLWRKEIGTKGRYKQWLISMQTGGVILRNPKKNMACMYGIVTT